MTFFSLTLILGLAGFKVSDLRHVDLRPSAIRQSITRGYYQTSAKVMKYYDSLQSVYRLQAGYRDLKNQFAPPEQEQQQQQQPSEEKKEKNDKDITRRPKPRRDQDAYSQRGDTMNLADARSISTGPNATRKRREA
jgi:hypothetical protein